MMALMALFFNVTLMEMIVVTVVLLMIPMVFVVVQETVELMAVQLMPEVQMVVPVRMDILKIVQEMVIVVQNHG